MLTLAEVLNLSDKEIILRTLADLERRCPFKPAVEVHWPAPRPAVWDHTGAPCLLGRRG